MLYKLENGKLISPPIASKKKNGHTVIHYDKLPKELLLSEGWKEKEVDIAPEEIPDGYELLWYYEEDDTTIYHRWRLNKLPESIEEE